MVARLKPPSDSTQVALIILLTIFYLKGISSTSPGAFQIKNKEKEDSLKNEAFIFRTQLESLDHTLLETILSELNGFNRSISVLINNDKKKNKDIEELKLKVDKLENGKYAPKRYKNDGSPMDPVNYKNERVDTIDESDSGRHRKAARLIPLTLLENKNKAEPDTMKNGMPTTCRDLNIIGYTLKGFYLVRNPDISTIETVFCDFKESQYSTHGEKRIGHVEIKSSPGIFFHAQRNKSFTATTGVLNFHFSRINKGGAMNLYTGVFTAPKRGIYHFSFMALKGWSSSDAGVILRLNENRKISASYARESFLGSILTMSLEATLKLEVGDKIDLYKNTGGTLMEGEESHKHHYMTQFSGQLLQEELNF